MNTNKCTFLSLSNDDNDIVLDNFFDIFKTPSNWEPPQLNPDHPIEQFLNIVLSNVSNPDFPNDLPRLKNLNDTEIKAITSLKHNKDIIILPADKGDVTVIMNKIDYITEARNQLEDKNTYEKLDKDLTEDFNNTINKFITDNSEKEGLSGNLTETLITKNPETPTFYILPKVHKNMNPPPG